MPEKKALTSALYTLGARAGRGNGAGIAGGAQGMDAAKKFTVVLKSTKLNAVIGTE